MRKILIIEENPEISEPLIGLLKSQGFNTILCHRRDHAVCYLDRFKPNLILLDLSLPIIDGLEACNLIRGKSNVPIIVISMNISQSIRLKCFELGADDFLSKPFSMPELLLRIHSILKRSGLNHKAAKIS